MSAAAIPLTQSEQRKGKLNKWIPKKWRPEYDRIVAYSVMGKSNKWIADELDFTPEHVSTILNLPEGVELAAKLHAKLRDRILVNIPDVLDEIAQKAVQRLKTVLTDDELFEKSPFMVVDRGLDVLKGLNHLRGGGNGSAQPIGSITNIGAVVINPQQKSDLMEGLKMVAEVKRIHGGSESK